MHNLNRYATIKSLVLNTPSVLGDERTGSQPSSKDNGCGGESGCKSYNGCKSDNSSKGAR